MPDHNGIYFYQKNKKMNTTIKILKSSRLAVREKRKEQKPAASHKLSHVILCDFTQVSRTAV